MSPTQEMKAISETLKEVERLDTIEERAGQDKKVHEAVEDLRERRLKETVRISVAARLLDVSVPTARAWASQGVLTRARHRQGPQRVTLGSVVRARRIVAELRHLGQQKKLLPTVLAVIEDQETLAGKRLRESLDQMRRGELVELTPPAS